VSERQALLAGSLVAYRLERARRRSIGFTVGPEGLRVRAPGWATLAVIETALRDKQHWIVRKLADVREREARQSAARIVWATGGVLPWLGQALPLRLGDAHRAPCIADGGLQVGLPAEAPFEAVREHVRAWMQREARLHFAARVAHYAPQLAVQPARLMLTSAATRCGSASASGVVRLNWRLLHYRPALIDYVVAHELAHLREMNHGPRFWAIVESVVPDHARLRRELRESTAPQWQ